MSDINDDDASDAPVADTQSDIASDTGELSADDIAERLSELKAEHRRIDNEITALVDIGAVDMLKLGRMKKIKLSMKDQITYLENQITPDIIA